MQVRGGHLFAMLDFALGRPPFAASAETLKELPSHFVASSGEFSSLMSQGSDWLFFGEGYVDERARTSELTFLYATDPEDILGIAGSSASPPRAGVRLAVQPQVGLGVMTWWQALAPGPGRPPDVLGAKLGVELRQHDFSEAFGRWGLDFATVGRITTFLAIQVDSQDLDAFVAENAVDIGRLLTGDQEHEQLARLASYATEGNLSTRGFERLYVRWTDALAVYDTSNDLMDPAAMRVARLVETGILMRRLLRETAFETEVAMKGERPWIPPWFSRGRARGERLRQIVAEAGLTTSIAPPTHSVEGEHLLADVLAAFDVPRLSEQCGLTLAELDRRFEWARARWLILITLLLFVMNTAIALHG